MIERPSFPPLLRPSAVPADVDPFERCIELAVEGAEPGTLSWSIGQDACEGAVVLAPEQPREQSLPIVLVAMLGLADGLGSLVPPAVPVTFGWPDRLEVNGAGGRRRALRERLDRRARRHSRLAGDRISDRHARCGQQVTRRRTIGPAPRSRTKAAR